MLRVHAFPALVPIANKAAQVAAPPYDTLDDAILLANGTRYGLQAGIFTDSLPSALRAAQELRFGGVTVNEAPTFRADQMPYGGNKGSGVGREGLQSTMHDYTEARVMVLTGLEL